MRVIVCLLLAMACGFGTYVLGAVLWSAADPQGAGTVLLFTIPPAIAGMAVPALFGVIALINRCDWAAPRPARVAPVAAQASTAAPRPARSAPAPARPAFESADDLQLAAA